MRSALSPLFLLLLTLYPARMVWASPTLPPAFAKELETLAQDLHRDWDSSADLVLRFLETRSIPDALRSRWFEVSNEFFQKTYARQKFSQLYFLLRSHPTAAQSLGIEIRELSEGAAPSRVSPLLRFPKDARYHIAFHHPAWFGLLAENRKNLAYYFWDNQIASASYENQNPEAPAGIDLVAAASAEQPHLAQQFQITYWGKIGSKDPFQAFHHSRFVSNEEVSKTLTRWEQLGFRDAEIVDWQKQDGFLLEPVPSDYFFEIAIVDPTHEDAQGFYTSAFMNLEQGSPVLDQVMATAQVLFTHPERVVGPLPTLLEHTIVNHPHPVLKLLLTRVLVRSQGFQISKKTLQSVLEGLDHLDRDLGEDAAERERIERIAHAMASEVSGGLESEHFRDVWLAIAEETPGYQVLLEGLKKIKIPKSELNLVRERLLYSYQKTESPFVRVAAVQLLGQLPHSSHQLERLMEEIGFAPFQNHKDFELIATDLIQVALFEVIEGRSPDRLHELLRQARGLLSEESHEKLYLELMELSPAVWGMWVEEIAALPQLRKTFAEKVKQLIHTPEFDGKEIILNRIEKLKTYSELPFVARSRIQGYLYEKKNCESDFSIE